jgi:hypothetical protein
LPGSYETSLRMCWCAVFHIKVFSLKFVGFKRHVKFRGEERFFPKLKT